MTPFAPNEPNERSVDNVRGTSDRLPDELSRLRRLEMILIDHFSKAGYDLLRTPVLEYTELHERKSGAGIVSKLFEIEGGGAGQGRVCLRPELTAGVVRAYAAALEPLELPWRVSHSGPVFRYETPKRGRLREFQQVGVERLGDSGAIADAEIIQLADSALTAVGVRSTSIRIGHVGLILEMLERSGLPAPLGAALTEMLSEAASDGEGVQALENGLEQLSGWLKAGEATELPASVDKVDDPGIDRLFRTLVPVVTGRRNGAEIVHRLRRKWDLSHGLLAAIDGIREQVHRLSSLKGKPAAVLEQLRNEADSLAPDSIEAISQLLQTLQTFGVDLERVELDLGFGRGIGFYSKMIFEIRADTTEGKTEVCGGGRYDGLARVLGSSRDDRGVGFAFGLERLDSVLQSQQSGSPSHPVRRNGFLIASSELPNEAIAIATALRDAGARAILEPSAKLDEAKAKARSLGTAWMVHVTPHSVALHDLSTEVIVSIDLKGLLKLALEAIESEGRIR